MATEDGAAYYDIVSRLKKTRLPFDGVSPGDVPVGAQGLVITTRKELANFSGPTCPIEDLSENPLIMKGQILSRLADESKRDLLVGIDPGSRMGVVVFYGGRELGALTANSVDELVSLLSSVAALVAHSTIRIKVGGGEPRSSTRLALALREAIPSGVLEIVDESGTSAIKRGTIGITRDQRAAVRIAFRKGLAFSEVLERRRRRKTRRTRGSSR